MSDALQDLVARLSDRLQQVQRHLGVAPTETGPDTRFADAVDSMGMVEFLALVAEDCSVSPTAVEECAGRRFGTVAELALALQRADMLPRSATTAAAAPTPSSVSTPASRTCWLAGVSIHLPRWTQSAASIDEVLHRPSGWLESHAGIHDRRIWADEDALAGAVRAGNEALERAGVPVTDVGALLVTSEAPPLLIGLAAALHHRLGLRSTTVALEVGGACTGFLAAVWLARALQHGAGVVLVVALETPSTLLRLGPGPAGEAAALFGDAAAAAIVCRDCVGEDSVPLIDVVLGSQGDAADLLRVERSAAGSVELHMEGRPLASRAIRVMADGVHGMARNHGLSVSGLAGVVAHGGNGRMAGLLARQLGLPPERVWSQTAVTGNLGSASLPAAWAMQRPSPRGPVAWTAVGAGLTWAAGLTGELSL
jgi:3-oxoacyl-[acyl-carrier-protein] synthase-3